MQGLSKKELLDELNRFLLACSAEEIFCVVIIDEAQNLAIGTLEQLRMLSNLETAKTKLLQIIFVGQLEFGEKLESERLKSLNQRISNRYRIEPLSRREVGEYIQHRLKVAQAPDELGFSSSALRSIRRFSRGYPRLINLICDRALLAGYSEKSFWISGRMIRKAARGLRGREEFHVRRRLLAGAFVPVTTLVLLAIVAALFLWSFRWGGPLKLRSFGEAEPARAMTRDMPREPEAEKAAPADVDRQPATPPVTEEPPQEPAPSATTQPPPVAAARRTEPIAPASPPPATRGSALVYTVQVHSLIAGDQAEKVVSQLRADGHEAFIKVEGKWSVILVGPFDDVKRAEESLTSIARSYGATPILRVSSEAAPR